MNNTLRFAFVVAGLSLMLGAIGHAQLCDEQVPDSLRCPDSLYKPFSLPDEMPFGMGLCVVSRPVRSGLVDMELRILANHPYDSIRVRLAPIGRLEILEPTDWLVNKTGEKTLRYPVQVKVPDHDTSGIEAKIFVTGWSANSTQMYFVTTGDTVEMYYEWPKPVIVERQKMLLRWGDTLEVLNDTPGKKLFLTPAGDTLSADTFDLWYKREMEEHIPPPDTVNIRHEIVTTPEGILARTEQGRKELMEREPFLAGTRQCIMVDGQVWVRDSGEYKFRPGRQVENGPAYVDSLVKARHEQRRNDSIHVVLDLRSSDDHDKVSRLVDDLRPMDRSGFYHAFVTSKVLKELKRIGIEISRHPYYPDLSLPKKKPTPSDGEMHNATVFIQSAPDSPPAERPKAQGPRRALISLPAI